MRGCARLEQPRTNSVRKMISRFLKIRITSTGRHGLYDRTNSESKSVGTAFAL